MSDKNGRDINLTKDNLLEETNKTIKEYYSKLSELEKRFERRMIAVDEHISELENNLESFQQEVIELDEGDDKRIERLEKNRVDKDWLDSHHEQEREYQKGLFQCVKHISELEKKLESFQQEVIELDEAKVVWLTHIEQQISELKHFQGLIMGKDIGLSNVFKRISEESYLIYKNREVLRKSLKRLSEIFDFSENNSNFFKYQIKKLDGERPPESCEHESHFIGSMKDHECKPSETNLVAESWKKYDAPASGKIISSEEDDYLTSKFYPCQIKDCKLFGRHFLDGVQLCDTHYTELTEKEPKLICDKCGKEFECYHDGDGYQSGVCQKCYWINFIGEGAEKEK